MKIDLDQAVLVAKLLVIRVVHYAHSFTRGVNVKIVHAFVLVHGGREGVRQISFRTRVFADFRLFSAKMYDL